MAGEIQRVSSLIMIHHRQYQKSDHLVMSLDDDLPLHGNIARDDERVLRMLRGHRLSASEGEL